jgi:di/tricarboxylate transporter
MTATAKQEDREQMRERLVAMRVVGGLLLAVALLLYFFHMAESRMGHNLLGSLAAIFGLWGAALLAVSGYKLRKMN